MQIGLLLPAGQAQLAAGGSITDIVGLAVRAERLGVDSVWVGDSLSRARVEPLTLLTAIARATETVRLGTATLIPAYRHPAQAALTLSSLDLVGADFKTRFSHLDDTVTLWK